MANYSPDGLPEELTQNHLGLKKLTDDLPDGSVVGPDGVAVYTPTEVVDHDYSESDQNDTETDTEEVVSFDPFSDDEVIFIPDLANFEQNHDLTNADKNSETKIKRVADWLASRTDTFTQHDTDLDSENDQQPDDFHDDDFYVEEDFKNNAPIDPMLTNSSITEVESVKTAVANQAPQVPAVISQARKKLHDWREDGRVDREIEKEATRIRQIELQIENQRRLENLNSREALERQIIELRGTTERFAPSPVEQDAQLGIKNFGLLSDITRVHLAIELYPATGSIIETADFGDLADVERAQVESIVERNLSRELAIRKVDLSTELDESRRRQVWQTVANAPTVMLNSALKRVLPEIYEMPDEKPVDLKTIGREHREFAFNAARRFTNLEDYVWGIEEDTRKITIKARMIPIEDSERGTISYEFDPNFNGIDKILGAAGKTLENEDPKGRDLRISGAFSLGPKDGGIVFSTHLSDVMFENVLPLPNVRGKEAKVRGELNSALAQHALLFEEYSDDATDTSLSVEQHFYTDATIDEHMRNPSLIAEFTFEPRYLTAPAYNEILGEIINRLSGNFGTVVDPREIAKGIATFIKDGAVDEIDRYGTATQVADRAAAMIWNQTMKDQGYGHLATQRFEELGTGDSNHMGAIEASAHTTQQDVFSNQPQIETHVVDPEQQS